MIFCVLAPSPWGNANQHFLATAECDLLTYSGKELGVPNGSSERGKTLCTRRDPSESLLGFRDLYETLLNKLRRPRHGICVDLDSGNEVGVSPAVDLCCSATEFDLHTALHQVCNKFLVWVACCNITVGIVRLVV